MSESIRIVCSAESHNGAVSLIAEFVPTGPRPDDTYLEHWYRWNALHPATRRRMRFVGERGIDQGEPTLRTNHLIEDQADYTHEEEGRYLIKGRQRYALKCRKCGLAVTARAEKLDTVFDTLKANGIMTIELASLAAIVR